MPIPIFDMVSGGHFGFSIFHLNRTCSVDHLSSQLRHKLVSHAQKTLRITNAPKPLKWCVSHIFVVNISKLRISICLAAAILHFQFCICPKHVLLTYRHWKLYQKCIPPARKPLKQYVKHIYVVNISKLTFPICLRGGHFGFSISHSY